MNENNLITYIKEFTKYLELNDDNMLYRLDALWYSLSNEEQDVLNEFIEIIIKKNKQHD